MIYAVASKYDIMQFPKVKNEEKVKALWVQGGGGGLSPDISHRRHMRCNANFLILCLTVGSWSIN